ncbi:TPA: hypothetical protein EYP84_01040 [Candidatus Bipolaricaulota bacterium]|nr:hypothetical protein [Candidatus Bipolaricaulota bacterium]HIP99448.1 hypothetical protein [Candidatus Bipolaricaulota bacterium]
MTAYLAVLAALALILPALGLGLVAVALGVLAGLTVTLAALALGATGSLLEWIITALTLAAGLKAWERGRRWLRRVRAALAD